MTKTKKTTATKKAAPKKLAPKVKKDATAAKERAPKRLSQIDAALKVLAESGEPMTTGAMVEAMSERGYWSSPNGRTPAATLYAAIIREIAKRGKDSRFKKAERGLFAATGKG